MWATRLFWRFLLVYVGLWLGLTIGLVSATLAWQSRFARRQAERRLHSTATILRRLVAPDLARLHAATINEKERGKERETEKENDNLQRGSHPNLHDKSLQEKIRTLAQQTGLRLTLLDPQGVVVADSHLPVEQLGHAINRLEIRQAAGTEVGVTRRPSKIDQVDTLFVALRCRWDGIEVGFVRTAAGLASIHRDSLTVRWFIWSFSLLMGLVGSIINYRMTQGVVGPLDLLRGRCKSLPGGPPHRRWRPLPITRRDELGKLADAFNQMQVELGRRLARLHRDNERLGAVLENMTEGVLAVDNEDHVLLANRATVRLLPLATSQLQARPLLEATRWLPLHEVIAQAKNGQCLVRKEVETSGAVRRRLQISAIGLAGDPVLGVLVVLHDVTELRRLENLRQELVANVSHELKTPLAAIKAYAETLRLGAINDTKNNLSFVAPIEEKAERLHQLILDMLQIARLESGQEIFEVAEVPLVKVVDSCLRRYAVAAAARKVSLDQQPPPQPVVAVADEEAVQVILDNLVDNAIKCTPAGGQVAVSWRRRDGRAVLEVSDTGIGISREHKSRVFERFYRADKARSREMGGTGLGLSIVKHLSQAMQGAVELESETGRGSVFRVWLPLAKNEYKSKRVEAPWPLKILPC